MFPAESEQPADICSHGGNWQRLASANKLRVVLFTSSRKLDTKADKKESALQLSNAAMVR